MKILLTGNIGYLGQALSYELYELHRDKYEVIGIDNNSRKDWVGRCGGGYQMNYNYTMTVEGDLTDPAFVDEMIVIHKPNVVIHLASQPSMPYSQINAERALFTQVNNLKMCHNLLWAIRKYKLACKFIITTTTGIPGQFYDKVPEGKTLNLAGSWYHISRGFDSANCSLAARQWGQNVIELRTSIVYGLQTEEMAKRDIATRFDTDPYFGTVVNRFVSQALEGKPITVYGKGEQTKPYISLEDFVKSTVNAIEYPVEGHEIFNH